MRGMMQTISGDANRISWKRTGSAANLPRLCSMAAEAVYDIHW